MLKYTNTRFDKMNNNTQQVINIAILTLAEEQYISLMKCDYVLIMKKQENTVQICTNNLDKNILIAQPAANDFVTPTVASSNRSRRFKCAMFELKNYTDEEYESLKQMNCRYIIISKEIGGQNLYGYVEFNYRITLSNLYKVNNRIHWKKRILTQRQVINLCKKKGDYIEIGQKRRQRKTPVKRSIE
uniref:Rep protein n=1 Tax=Apapanepox virus TaxID=3049969 RepID=A0AAT9UPR0_9POXV